MRLPWIVVDLLVFLNMSLLSIPIYVVGPFEKQKKFSDFITRTWMGSIFRLTGVTNPPELEGQLPGAGPYIVMCNHQSHLDVALLIWKVKLKLRFVAKRELLFVPVFGFTMWVLGHITVDRRNRERAIESLERAAEKIRGGTSVLVFPEGTRNNGPDHDLLPFKKGGFMLAIQSGVPILPCAIAGTARRFPKGSPKATPGPVCFRFGDPIPTDGLGPDDRDQLMARVRAEIDQLRKQALLDLNSYEAERA